VKLKIWEDKDFFNRFILSIASRNSLLTTSYDAGCDAVTKTNDIVVSADVA
jgi:hypothetical protein